MDNQCKIKVKSVKNPSTNRAPHKIVKKVGEGRRCPQGGWGWGSNARHRATPRPRHATPRPRRAAKRAARRGSKAKAKDEIATYFPLFSDILRHVSTSFQYFPLSVHYSALFVLQCSLFFILFSILCPLVPGIGPQFPAMFPSVFLFISMICVLVSALSMFLLFSVFPLVPRLFPRLALLFLALTTDSMFFNYLSLFVYDFANLVVTRTLHIDPH